MTSTVLITGGLGYIGSHVVVAAQRAGWTPVVVDNGSTCRPDALARLEKTVGQKISFFPLNVAATQDLRAVMARYGVSAVIHLAALKSVGQSVQDPGLYYRHNLGGLLSVLDAMDQAHVTNILYSSSATIYQPVDGQALHEDDGLGPANPYGWTKRMGEQMVRDWVAGHPTRRALALRYFNPIGADPLGWIGDFPLGDPQNLMPNICRAASGGAALKIYGDDYATPDRTALRDYVHIMDISEAHIHALKNFTKPFEVYNLGTGAPVSVLEIIQAFEAENDIKVPYSVAPRRPGDPASVYASVARVAEDWGWQAQRPLMSMVRDAWIVHQRVEATPGA